VDQLRQLAKQARQERETIASTEGELLQEQGVDLDQASEELRKRNEIREERRRDRERERHLDSLRKKSKTARDEDRDVSEKIALGIKPMAGQAAAGNETMFDQRLFNQQQGLDHGFGAEDSYTVYDKPLFGATAASQIYKPKRAGDGDMFGDEENATAASRSGQTAPSASASAELRTAQFRPDKDFSGVDRSKKVEQRSRPVEFERDSVTQLRTTPAVDDFGIDAFLKDAKAGAKKPLDKIGQQGGLAAGSAGSASAEQLQQSGKSAAGSSSRKIDFQSAGSSASSTSNNR